MKGNTEIDWGSGCVVTIGVSGMACKQSQIKCSLLPVSSLDATLADKLHD